MDTKTTVIAVVVGIIVVAGGFVLFGGRAPMAIPEVPQSTNTSTYQNEEYNLSFEYPSNLYLYEGLNQGTETRPQLALFLVEDTQENRDVLEGRATEAREGPIGISVDVYQNPEELSASEWVQNDTNWTVATSEAEPVTVAGKEGVSFTWSGLYEGRTVVVTEGDKAYVMSTTWMTPEDHTLSDFELVLNSLSI